MMMRRVTETLLGATVIALFACFLTTVDCLVCEGKLQIHTDPSTHDTRCCEQRTCSAGYQPRLCPPNNADIALVCEACVPGTYKTNESSSTDISRLCIPHSRQCLRDAGMMTLEEGTSTAEPVCVCDFARGYYTRTDDKLNPRECFRHNCGPNETLTLNGCRKCSDQPSSASDSSCLPQSERCNKDTVVLQSSAAGDVCICDITRGFFSPSLKKLNPDICEHSFPCGLGHHMTYDGCKPCPERTFSNTTGFHMSCADCTQCSSEAAVVKECTNSNNTVCQQPAGTSTTRSPGHTDNGWIALAVILPVAFIIAVGIGIYLLYRCRRPNAKDKHRPTTVGLPQQKVETGGTNQSADEQALLQQQADSLGLPPNKEDEDINAN